MNPARRTTAGALVLATAGGLLTAVAAPASAAATCASPVLKRQFFANTTFKGTPKKTDCDTAVDQSWSGAPVSGLPKDNFSVRWTVTRDFGSGGPFALNATGLDGIRVHLDGVRRIDLWKNVSTTVKKTANVTIPSGRHTLRIDYANWTGAAKVKVTYAPRTSADVDKVKPLVPTGTSVSYDRATGKAKVTWAKNKEMDLAGYRVYRRLKGTSFPAAPLTTTTSTSYTDSALPATGDTYSYEVRARDKAGNESGGTADQSVVTADRTAPAAATGLTAVGTTAGNSVTWQASSSKDVEHYEVWASRNGDPDPDGPEIVLGTSFADRLAEAGVPYTYTVQAIDTATNISPVSKVTATRPIASAVPAPADVTGTPADASTTLVWTAATDATGYRVYRRTDVNGAWSLVGSASGTSYEDTSAPRGKAYYYLASVDAQDADSAPSAEVTVDRLTPATATGPAEPLLSLVTNGVPGRSPIQVEAVPGTGDESRVLKGYAWEMSGACGSSGDQFSTTGTLSWTAPWNGPCIATVFAVDAYGRKGARSAELSFFSGR